MTALVVQHTRRDVDFTRTKVINPYESRNEWKTVEEAYGDVEVLFTASPAGFDANAVAATLDERMQTFDDNDAIVTMGSPYLIACTVAYACEHNEGRAWVLEWDKHPSGYHARHINLDGNLWEAFNDLP